MARQITRKQFVSGGMVAAIVVASGCASDDTGDGDESEGGSDCGAGANGNISGNHGHTASVAAADITAAAAKDYDIMGSSAHSHTISVTAAQMGELAAGDSVTVTSTMAAGHSHDVTLAC